MLKTLRVDETIPIRAIEPINWKSYIEVIWIENNSFKKNYIKEFSWNLKIKWYSCPFILNSYRQTFQHRFNELLKALLGFYMTVIRIYIVVVVVIVEKWKIALWVSDTETNIQLKFSSRLWLMNCELTAQDFCGYIKSDIVKYVISGGRSIFGLFFIRNPNIRNQFYLKIWKIKSS